MVQIFRFLIVLLVFAILAIVVRTAFIYILPGNRRLARLRRKKQGNGHEYDVDGFIRRMLPADFYRWLELFINRTGQSLNWTVEKTIRYMTFGFFSGCIVFVFILLMYFSIDGAPVFTVFVGVLMPFASASFYLLLFRMERSEFLNNIIFQTPEFLDILEAELVRGGGNLIKAIQQARSEIGGSLNTILDNAYRYYHLNHGDIIGACDLIQEQVNYSLYDQITLLMKQYRMTGRAKKFISHLQSMAKREIEVVTKKQTAQKNLILVAVSLGIVANLLILAGVPVVFGIMNHNFHF